MKMVVLDGYALNPGDLSWEGIRQFGELIVYDRTPVEMIVERAKEADIIFTNKTPIRQSVLDQLPSLKYIGVLATGYNIVDTQAARAKGIPVANIPGYGTHSVVQMVFALLLEHCMHVQKHSDAVRNLKWANAKDWCFWDFPLQELLGKTMGIIGFGTIGQEVANVATAFGMQIMGCSRTQTDQSHRKNFQWVSLPELLQMSDVVSIHCPLTEETNGMINQTSLRTMKPSAFLINTSRGPVIVDQDLADALNESVIAGAGIDVLSVEPPSAYNPLFTAKNCLITPHIAWSATEARIRLMDILEKNVAGFLQGNPVNVVNG
jgi:glycerate dehydrogenase